MARFFVYNVAMSTTDVVTFWFAELTPKDWFTKSDELDATIVYRFKDFHNEVAQNEVEKWLRSPQDALSAIIVLDQFSRNMFRGTKESFAYDEQALLIAQQAIAKGFDTELPEEQRVFMYMPYMHSEDPTVHETAVELFDRLESKENLQYEHLHKKIIDRFGRYPHRNEILGRESTPEELDFLANDKHASF